MSSLVGLKKSANTKESIGDREKRLLGGVPGSYLLPIRFILGFQFFTAWARRYLNAPSKLNYESASNIGHKFNVFMPHAIEPIKAMIQYLLMHPHLTWDFLIFFTWVEFTVGLFLMTGTFTRIAAFGGAMLSFGMLLGNGWIGTSCIDEFQIGSVEGIASMVFMFAGYGGFGVDGWLRQHWSGYVKIGSKKIYFI